MKKKLLIALLAGVSFLITGASLYAEEAEKVATVKNQINCPVMGGKVNKNLYYDYKEKRIFVCCRGCISAIKKNPTKYIKKLEKAGVIITKVKKAKAKSQNKGHSNHQH